MKRKMKIRIILGAIALVCVAYGLLGISYSVGWTKKGVVDEINKLPYFGKYLEGFEVIGNINYQRRKYARGVNCFFSGRTSTESFDKFCNQVDGWDFMSVDRTLINSWRDKIKSADQDPDTFPLNDVTVNKYARKIISIDGEMVKIEIIFVKKNESFVAFASKTRPD